MSQQKLFDHMHEAHGLILTSDEMEEIQRIVREIDESTFKITLLERLLEKAKTMREAQREYFRKRDALVLRLSKRLETEFDKEAEKVPTGREKSQQTLF